MEVRYLVFGVLVSLEEVVGDQFELFHEWRCILFGPFHKETVVRVLLVVRCQLLSSNEWSIGGVFFRYLDYKALFGLDELADVLVVGRVGERSVRLEAVGTEIGSLLCGARGHCAEPV